MDSHVSRMRAGGLSIPGTKSLANVMQLPLVMAGPRSNNGERNYGYGYENPKSENRTSLTVSMKNRLSAKPKREK